jgi:hypothetical protein
VNFDAAKAKVSNRGTPPDHFLAELLVWGRVAPEEIFSVNPVREEIYTSVRHKLGPWEGATHRRAAMLEVLRVLAGFESSWDWDAGVDTTNRRSMSHIESEETGAFQVSFDSIGFHPSLPVCVLKYCEALKAEQFIEKMKSNHSFAMEYAARLLRRTIRHNGPVLRQEIHPWLSRESMWEFHGLLL